MGRYIIVRMKINSSGHTKAHLVQKLERELSQAIDGIHRYRRAPRDAPYRPEVIRQHAPHARPLDATANVHVQVGHLCTYPKNSKNSVDTTNDDLNDKDEKESLRNMLPWTGINSIAGQCCGMWRQKVRQRPTAAVLRDSVGSPS